MGRVGTVRRLWDFRGVCVWRECDAEDHSDPNDVHPAHGDRISTPGRRTECESFLQAINAGEKGRTQTEESQSGPDPDRTQQGDFTDSERSQDALLTRGR